MLPACPSLSFPSARAGPTLSLELVPVSWASTKGVLGAWRRLAFWRQWETGRERFSLLQEKRGRGGVWRGRGAVQDTPSNPTKQAQGKVPRGEPPKLLTQGPTKSSA